MEKSMPPVSHFYGLFFFADSVAERKSVLITPDLSKCAVFRNVKPLEVT